MVRSAAISVFFIGIGYDVTLVPRALKEGLSAVNAEEWKVAIGLMAITALLFFISFVLPNEKSKTLKKIKRHFEGNEPTKHAVKGLE